MDHLAAFLSYTLGQAVLYEMVILVGFCLILRARVLIYAGIARRRRN